MNAGLEVVLAVLVGAVIAGAVVLSLWLRAWADDRARERRYADEWVRRHREGRTG